MCRMIRGGNRRIPAASTAGYQTRLRKCSSVTGPPCGAVNTSASPVAAGHQHRHALKRLRRHRHDPVRPLGLRPLPQALARHDVDNLEPAAQPVHPVAMQPVQLARAQADLHAQLDHRPPLGADRPAAAYSRAASSGS